MVIKEFERVGPKKIIKSDAKRIYDLYINETNFNKLVLYKYGDELREIIKNENKELYICNINLIYYEIFDIGWKIYYKNKIRSF